MMVAASLESGGLLGTSEATGGCGEVGADAQVLCVHYSADGRSHRMWFLDADCPPEQAPADLWAYWRVTPDEGWCGALLQRRERVMDAALFTQPDRAQWPHGRLGRDQAALLVGVRHRPLMVTRAVGGDIPSAKLKAGHALLARAAVAHAGSWDDWMLVSVPLVRQGV